MTDALRAHRAAAHVAAGAILPAAGHMEADADGEVLADSRAAAAAAVVAV